MSGKTYNICSDEERSVRGLLSRIPTIAGADVMIRQDPARLRPAEQRRVCGSVERIRCATGWRASTPFDESLRTMLGYWERQDALPQGD